jgi:selenocysteine lyase/cysteine desulfurase
VTTWGDERSAYDAFLAQYPSYRDTRALDELRARDYARLDEGQHAYLDYTGSGLYASSQLRAHLELIEHAVLGNPHSASLTSAAATTLVERTRRRILDWFDADPSLYTVVFTPNATGALKHVGEAYPFSTASRLLLTYDNHNSVNGMRLFAAARAACVDYVPLTMPDLRIDESALYRMLDARDVRASNLFAFPAQSNFTGVRHPLRFVGAAKERGWDVLLDAAAYVPTNRLSLRQVPADFVTASFYKMFGYPTGVGCLVARHDALQRLHRPWFAGGTVNFATVHGRAHVLAPREAGFEDGTVNFLSIPAVEIGLDFLERAGIDLLKTRLTALTGWLLEQLLLVRHANGRHMVRIYGPADTVDRGATVTFNLYDPDGHLLDYRRVEELATAERISVRTGCFCNPGAGETAEGITDDDVRLALEHASEMSLPRFMQLVQERGGRSAGAIRASLGIATNFSDVWRLVTFIRRFVDQTRLAIGAVSFDVETCRIIRDGS